MYSLAFTRFYSVAGGTMPGSEDTKTGSLQGINSPVQGKKRNQRCYSGGKGCGTRKQGGVIVWCLRPQSFGLTNLGLTFIPTPTT